MYDFLNDLDEFFCEKYANYDKLCILPEYRMPMMQASRTDEWGRTFAYTLPSNTMRLALQEKKESLLKTLKSRIVDKSFSFSFIPLGKFKRLKYAFSKTSPKKELIKALESHKITVKEAGEALDIDAEIWQGICKGKYVPTKNTIFSLAFVAHLTYEETADLLASRGYVFDYATEKDVVIAYLLQRKIYNLSMVASALNEYKITGLYLRF